MWAAKLAWQLMAMNGGCGGTCGTEQTERKQYLRAGEACNVRWRKRAVDDDDDMAAPWPTTLEDTSVKIRHLGVTKKLRDLQRHLTCFVSLDVRLASSYPVSVVDGIYGSFSPWLDSAILLGVRGYWTVSCSLRNEDQTSQHECCHI
nr:hypothetical protein CFP56_32208 [Quercus suber]